MRRFLRKHIPSMFHRRLLLLMMLATFTTAVLAVQAARLTTGEQHRQRLARVHDALRDTELIPTIRGRVLDRWGRVLATDERGQDVAVYYTVISGEWAYEQAAKAARRSVGKAWGELDSLAREALIAEFQPPFDQQAEMLWQTLADLGGVDRLEIEQRKNAITRRVQNVASHLWATWRRKRAAELGEEVKLAEVAQPIGEQRQSHPILINITPETALRIQSFIAEGQQDEALAVWRYVKLRQAQRRTYPLETMTVVLDRSSLPGPLRSDEPMEMTVEGVGVHFLGQMRSVWQEDVDSETGRPFRRTNHQGQQVIDLGGYLPGDSLGNSGVEAIMERRLRGSRGRLIRYLDSNTSERVEPQPGRDVNLTVDIHLQARIAGIMSPQFGLMKAQPWHAPYFEAEGRLGEPLNGAAVVLDINTSQILAAVSVPAMPLRLIEEDPKQIFGDEVNRPWLNRVSAQPYQPGSTIKPIMLVAAASAGAFSLHEPIVCNGHLNPDDPEHYRCWIYKRYQSTHGPLLGPESIARSCNIYFYTLGRTMGVSRTAQWYSGFGLGSITNAGFPDEVAGDLPDTTKGKFGIYDAIFMGIGQGPVRWTPLQAAGAWATMARGGVAMSPTLIADEHRYTQRETTDLHLNQVAVREALQGLREVVEESYGSGRSLSLPGNVRERIFNASGVRIFGKSGTAQGVPLRIDSDNDGKITTKDEIVRKGDHSWFMAMVQPDGAPKPTHVIAVVVEFGGSGSQAAGPIVNQIIHALQTEGYL